MNWFALDVKFEKAASEAVGYALMEAGALGTEEGVGADGAGELSSAVAYFESRPDGERLRELLVEALRIYAFPSSALREMQVREVEERDWLAEWKKQWQPVETGRRFIVAPPWTEVCPLPDCILIRIEPGMAFGTGTHETTRLCLAAIEEYFDGGSFLDVGTGTGILAIAAARLAPEARVEACDTDGAAITIAHQNARLNGVAEQVNFRVGTADETTEPADIVCANLTADVIINLLPTLLSLACRRLVLSGILQTQVPDVAQKLSELGIASGEIFFAGEWAVMTTTKQNDE
ncbi:MAG TPA: 50S ribosomal protein L11 methyltransferase [Pyrinomonadaceae bacterium]|jgi:ribosomal protein L11 methyltransferase